MDNIVVAQPVFKELMQLWGPHLWLHCDISKLCADDSICPCWTSRKDKLQDALPLIL